MAEVGLRAAEKPRAEAVPSVQAVRLFFVDHWRAALIILVVLHHVALVYGAGAPFYYVEPPLTDPLAYVVLLTFVLFNQAWFMGALFLISGYFTPRSFDRQGSTAFLKNRMLRLGIPLLIWVFVLNPISATGYWKMPAALTGIEDPLTFAAYPFLIGLGVAWFLALLLIFDFAYAAWREPKKDQPATVLKEAAPPTYPAIILFVLALTGASFLMRIVIPMGKTVAGFPTLSYLPQYLSFFVLGTCAYRRNWFRTIPGSMGAAGFIVALVATILLFPLALSGRPFSMDLLDPAAFLGNGTWQSAAYALWDSTFAVGLCLASISLFRRFFNRDSSFGSFLAQQSYAVYLIHVPIIVLIAVLLMDLDFAALPKFALVSAIAVPTCFIVAYLVRKIPGVSRIL